MGRFHTQDRFAEKYVDFTPYQYGANNAILFIDVIGDSLKVSGLQESQDQFSDVINYGLGGFYNVENKDGMTTLSATGKEVEMSDQQKEFYNSLSEVIGDEGTTSIGLVSKDSEVEIGSYFQEKIDVFDVMQLGQSNLTNPEAVNAQGAITHEISEQYQKQVNNLGPVPAHKVALNKEAGVVESFRKEVGTFKVTNKSGQVIGHSLQSISRVNGQDVRVNIIIVNGNVIGKK